MNRKVIILFVLLVLLIESSFSNLFAVNVYAVDQQLQVSAVHFHTVKNGQDTEIYSLEQGTVKAEVNVTNQTGSDKTAVLLLALYKESNNEIQDMFRSNYETITNGASKTIRCNMNITQTQGLLLKAFLWDDTDYGNALNPVYGMFDRLIPPAAPQSLAATNITYFSQKISWDKPDHHLDVVSYDVYRDNMKITNTPALSFTDSNLVYGTTYKYRIVAVDGAGSRSNLSSELSAKTVSAAYMILKEQNEYALLNRDIPYNPAFDSGFYHEAVITGPSDDQRWCRKIQFIKPYNGNANGAANYLCFAVNDTYILKTDNNVTIKLTYLDSGTDTIGVQYNSPTDAYKNVTFNKTNTGKWATKVLQLTDAAFDNKQTSSTYDFRISTGESNTTEYIQKVEIFKGLVN